MKKQSAMAALASAAMAIPVLAQANVAPTETALAYRYNAYAEQDYNPLALGDVTDAHPAYGIINHQYHLSGGIGKRFGYYVDYGFETLAGASVQAAYQNGEVNGDGDIRFTGQNHLILGGASIVESRFELAVGSRLYNDRSTVGGEGYYSEENDYRSAGGSFDTSIDNQDQTRTYSLGLSAYFDELTPTGSGVPVGDKPPEFQASRVDAWQQNKLQISGFNGFSAVVNKNLLAQVGGSVTYQTGYLSDPYRHVVISCGDQCIDDPGTKNVDESGVGGTVHYSTDNRPDHRIMWTLSSGLRQFISATEGVLHLDTRYYGDTWGVHSLTTNAAFYQRFNYQSSAKSGFSRWLANQETSLLMAPYIRLHGQKQANFYRLMVDPEITNDLVGRDGNLPAAIIEGNQIVGYSDLFSSDPRLSTYGAVALGINSELSVAGVRVTAGGELYRASGTFWGLASELQDTNGLPQYWRASAGLEYRF
ncbi:DUF3570 domain-containing protein [Salinibius halmophilus]|uniref:DUF3570 domain-containing protein n=1 Tax=Salinibius halmophilus TaxID=1853216 RepID=UPI000E66BB60|nr:DUF3570 domain-containing protein [Salinibius halmophilus]